MHGKFMGSFDIERLFALTGLLSNYLCFSPFSYKLEFINSLILTENRMDNCISRDTQTLDKVGNLQPRSCSQEISKFYFI